MARSIHDTRGALQRARQASFSDPDVQRAIVKELKDNLRRQWAFRSGERRHRRRGRELPPPVDVDHLPILIDDQAPYLFHPATEEDIRAVLRRLPRGSLDGLREIRLCVDNRTVSPPFVCDPFTGRRRHEIVPGVFMSTAHGCYAPWNAVIRLHAYLCEPETVAPFRVFFKVSALKTLLHEAAHHFDDTYRVGRGRWDLDDRDKAEDWAERREDEDAARIVGAYVRARYPADCRDFHAWVEEHGGAAPEIGALIDRCDSWLQGPVLTLIRSVRAGHGRDTTRAAFARALHNAGENEIALEIVRGLPADHPGALAVSACLAGCKLGDLELAESLAQRAITLDPACVDAWEVLARSHWKQEKWDRAAEACERALAGSREGDGACRSTLRTLVESRLLLGDPAAVDAAIARMRAWGPKDCARLADVYDVLARCWAERWEEALVRVSRMERSGPYQGGSIWLDAVRFECAHRLGQPRLAGDLEDRALVMMERRPFTRAWAQRIREHVPRASQ